MAVTPNYGWPVPVATDLVKDGYEAIADLGDAIDATVHGLGDTALILLNATTFSAVSSQSINDVFSATYQNYKIILNCTHSVGGIVVNMRYRVSAADNTTANYQQSTIGLANDGSGIFSNISLNATAGTIGTFYLTGNAQEINVFNPFATAVSLQTTSITSLSTSTHIVRHIGSGFNATTSFTGFSLIPVSGTITGTVRVYGVKNT